MVIITSDSTIFTALPTEEEQLNDNDHFESSPDQILDGLLTKVGYGLFQKKLLVKKKRRYSQYFFLLNNSYIHAIGIMWVWLVSR
jgi:hypothetical protein